MKKNIFFYKILFSLYFILSCKSNTDISEIFYTNSSINKEIRWIINGKIADKNHNINNIVAVAINGYKYYAKPKNNNFILSLPPDITYSLHFIDKNDNINTFYFEDSNDVGKLSILKLDALENSQILNLGEIDIIDSQAFSSINPTTFLDNDKDGISNFLDKDDQNDGLDDALYYQELSMIEVCHKEKKDEKVINRQVYIALYDFYSHFLHGDYVGPCNVQE